MVSAERIREAKFSRSSLEGNFDELVGILSVFTLLPLVGAVGDHREPSAEPGHKNEDDGGRGGLSLEG